MFIAFFFGLNICDDVSAPFYLSSFNFNFFELDFLMNKTKIVDVGNPAILGNSNPNVVPIILNNT